MDRKLNVKNQASVPHGPTGRRYSFFLKPLINMHIIHTIIYIFPIEQPLQGGFFDTQELLQFVIIYFSL